LPWLVVVLTIFIWGGGIVSITFHLRNVIRAQILQVYAEVLYSATVQQNENVTAQEDDFMAPEEQQLLSILEASKARQGVFAVRVFNTNGEPVTAFGPTGSNAPLSAREMARLNTLKPFAEYDPHVDLAEFTGMGTRDGQESSYPLLRVLTPLHNAIYNGAAEFILDGESVSFAFREVDRDLQRWGFLIFFIGGTGIIVALAWAFARLQKSNALLMQRTESLVRANQELTLAAKTSAVGAITAHLIHDLKSPLFGLQSFVSSRATNAEGDEEDWNLAIDTTRRMQKMIGDIVKILQEEKTVTKYEISISEWAGLLTAKIEPQARDAGLELISRVECEAMLTNKDANILLLVSTNILHNAVQATPRGGVLTVAIQMHDGALSIELADNGPGLPESILSTLFTPSRSTKAGGTGLGLAISKQLTTHIGAELRLKNSSREGTRFELVVPDSLLVKKTELIAP
jgi:signal transduction histidine kinase